MAGRWWSGGRARAGLLGLSLALAVVPAQAQATPAEQKETARRHFERALALARDEAYADAAVELRLAYQASPDFSVLYNLGQAHAALGQSVEAIDAFERYLEQGGTRIPAARRSVVNQELARQRQRTARLVVSTEPQGALVLLDGKPIGDAPLDRAVLVNPGEHTLQASLEGYRTTSTHAVARSQTTAELKLTLERIALPESPKTGTIVLRCPVPDVLLKVDDGTSYQPFPAGDVLVLSAGLHRIAFARSGYVVRSHSVLADVRAAQTVDCGLAPRQDLGASELGELAVVGGEGSLWVLVDGSPVRYARLPIGRHRIEVADPVRGVSQQLVTVVPGRRTLVRLAPEPGRVTSPVRPPLRTAALLTGGTGLALGITSLVAFLVADGKYDDYLREQTAIEQAARAGATDLSARWSRNQQLAEGVEHWDAAAAVLAGAGGSLVASAVVLWLLDGYGRRKPNESMPVAGVAAGLTGGGAWATWQATF